MTKTIPRDLLQSGLLRLALVATAALGLAVPASAQQASASPTLDPKALTLFQQPADSWPTYNGDYSGRRYISLDQINQKNIGQLKTKWKYKIEGISIRGSGRGSRSSCIRA